jgi:hypothetical protein
VQVDTQVQYQDGRRARITANLQIYSTSSAGGS